VLAFGVIGPPEPSIITGYDEGGDVLIGWSFFQSFPDFAGGVAYEPSGYFRKCDWFKDTDCLCLIGQKQTRPDFGKVCREALQWALHVTRTPLVYSDRFNGLAAYDAWAERITHDSDFLSGDEATLRARFDIHNNAVGAVAEARWYGSQFLLQAVDFLPWQMAEPVLHAAACYAGEHELMWKLWDLAGGNGNPDGWKALTVPAVRPQMAEVILQSRAKYAEAADHIERALAKA
jgi:hypothetical protein